MRNLYTKTNQLDEMQEQTLLKIESQGFWLLWSGLLAAILLQIIFQFPPMQIAGELILFLVSCGYMLVQCLRNGIWDRHLQANFSTSLISALIAGAAVALINGFVWKSPISGMLGGIFTFMLTLGLMQLSSIFYHKKRKELDADDPGNE